MSRTLAAFAFSLGLLTSYAASAQINAPDSATPAAAAPAAATAPDSKVASNAGNALICRYENVVGTRFAKRMCYTQRQWKQHERDAYDLLDRLDSGKDQSIFQ